MTLLIDRAAAAEVPSDEAIHGWARDKRVFVSSVIEGLREERDAAAAAVRSLGARAVMFEEFGGRDANAQDAYLDEVETCQVYLGILGERYGTPVPPGRFSATHAEYLHAEQRGLRIAIWTLPTEQREGHQQSFLNAVRAFYVVPTATDLERQVRERLRDIAAEDLSPWAKLGPIVFRASKVKHAEDEITVTARVHSDDVAHALEALAPTPPWFGAGEERRFTWDGRCRCVRVASVESTTTTASSTLMDLQLKVVKGKQDPLPGVGFGGQTPDDLTDKALRVVLFGESNPLATQHMGLALRMVKMSDPLQPLREAKVSEEIVRSLAEVMIVDELVGSGRAARVTKFRLGASVGGQRRLELEWEPPPPLGTANKSQGQRRSIDGLVAL